MDLDNFIIGKTKERRGEGRFGKKKSNSCLANIEQQLMAKIAKKQQWPTGPTPPSCIMIKMTAILVFLSNNVSMKIVHED